MAKLTQKDGLAGIMNCSKERTRTLFGTFGSVVAVLSTTVSIARIRGRSRKRWCRDGRFSQGIEIRRLEIGGLCGRLEKNRQQGCQRSRELAKGIALRSGLGGWPWSGGRGCWLGVRGAGRGRFVVEGEVLGFVVLDGTEEGVVIGGAIRGDLPQKKMDVA